MSTISSTSLVACRRERSRARNRSREGHVCPRPSRTRSSSRALKGGNAPGKLAVARAAKASSAVSASRRGRKPRALKPIVRRCSVSITSGGLFSASASSWPLKSVTVTNRSSGCPSGSSGFPAGAAAMASNASSSRPEKPSPPNGGANHLARTRFESLRRTSSRVSGATVLSTVSPRLRISSQSKGATQNLVKRERGRASGSSSVSASADFNQSSVRGSSDCPLSSA